MRHRYFFHVNRGQVTILDQEGVELADIREAAREAARRGWEIAAREALNAAPAGAGKIIIDDEWRTVLELPLQDIVDVACRRCKRVSVWPCPRSAPRSSSRALLSMPPARPRVRTGCTNPAGAATALRCLSASRFSHGFLSGLRVMPWFGFECSCVQRARLRRRWP